MILPISWFVSPCQTKRAIWISFAVSRSGASLNHFLVSDAATAELHAFAPIPDSGTQKKRSQVLRYDARTNAQLAGHFLVAAALHQQISQRLVCGRPPPNEIHHHNSSCNLSLLQIPLPMFRQTSACHPHV